MITTAIIIYIVSVYMMWRYIRIAHSKGGIWENVKTKASDLFMIFLPFSNTVFAFFNLFDPPRKRKTKRNFNKFFAINDNRSLFQRIQYFLSKGKKFAPRETHFH